ncbi:MAG: hypothetical protein ACPGWM_03245 [Flavobacteriales bacterium]
MEINSNDKWKAFLSSNQSEFEDSEPSSDLWNKINADLSRDESKETKESKVSIKWLFTVAAACLLFGVLGTSWFYSSSSDASHLQAGTIVETKSQIKGSFGMLSAELNEVENYYIQEVSFRMKELSKYEVDEEWLLELELLQADFASLQNALEEGANREKVIEAMIQNYRIRLSILEDLLEELEEMERSTTHYEA